MRRIKFIRFASVCTLLTSALAQEPIPLPAPSPESSAHTIACKVMEVFAAQKQGVNAIIFHQRDKVDGPRLGELLKSYSGREMEFETKNGQSHQATIMRMKSCFGRGLLIIASGDVKLGEKDEFILKIPRTK